MEWLAKKIVVIFCLQNCSYKKTDESPPCPGRGASVPTAISAAGSIQALSDAVSGEEGEQGAGVVLPQRSVSHNSVDLLVSDCLGFADNFDLSELTSAIAKIGDLKAQMQRKWAFLQELEVNFICSS